MASNAQRRLMKDLQKMQKQSEDEGIFAAVINDNLYNWEATIEGPANTMWENGLFELKLQFS
jgi:ubiquitin-conjugating enzyme E2 G1